MSLGLRLASSLSMVRGWRVVLAVLALLCQVSCQGPPTRLSEDEIRTRIQGSWTANVREGRVVGTMLKTFHPNGTATGRITAAASKRGIRFHVPPVQFHDRWRVVGDVIETYDIHCNDPELFPPGTVLRDRLISFSGDLARFYDLTHKKPSVLRRATSEDLRDQKMMRLQDHADHR